jgi:hypothetical protein
MPSELSLFIEKYNLIGKRKSRIRLTNGLKIGCDDYNGLCIYSKFGNSTNPIVNWKKEKISFELALLLVKELRK